MHVVALRLFNPQRTRFLTSLGQARRFAPACWQTRALLHVEHATDVIPSSTSKAVKTDSNVESTLPHPQWSAKKAEDVPLTHFVPQRITDHLAYGAVKLLRFSFDIMSGYSLKTVDERSWLNRIVFLETVAGVPGMVAAMIRHLRSLRRVERDFGWIHTLLEEAENERMHLITMLALKRPTLLFRAGVVVTQHVFLLGFTTVYLLNAKFAHRFVGYLEEEAVMTYTKLLKELDHQNLPLFTSLPAPRAAQEYWCLEPNAMFRDVVSAIRADESHHRDVNHTFASMPHNAPNPFLPGH